MNLRLPLTLRNSRPLSSKATPFCVEFLCTDPLLPSGWYRFPMFRGKRSYDDPVGPFATYEQAVLGETECS